MTKIFEPDDFLKNHILTNLKIHPSEKWGMYFDNTLDLESNSYVKRIYHLDLKTYESNQIELDIYPDDYYFHGDFVIFKVLSGSGNRNETALYSYRVEEAELLKVCTIPFAVKEIGCGTSKMYFTASINNADHTETVYCSNTSPYFGEGMGVVGQTITGLFEADYSGKEIRVLTDLEMDIDLIDYDFENDRIAFTAYKSMVQKPVTSSVFTYDIGSGQLEMFTQAEYRIDGLLSMTKDVVYFGGLDLNKYDRNNNQQIHKINLRDGSVGQHGPNIDMSNERPGIITDSIFSKGGAEQRFGNAYYHLRIAENNQVLCALGIDGSFEQIDTGLTAITSFMVLKNEIILIGLKDQSLSEIYKYSGGQLTQITNRNAWLDSYKVSCPIETSVVVDGVEVKGWVCPPHQIEADKKYPGILMIHGGPKMMYSDVFSFEMQTLCASGYYVFYANPMGSDGRGDAYAEIRGCFDTLPYKQLMCFTDQVIENHIQLDADRLGVTGGSYGGYMTNHIITKTDRFKAAVSERGISNMMTALTSSDIGYMYAPEYAKSGSEPWSNLDKLLEISPIMNVEHTKTPTLFNHGKDDFRCHYTESLNMYTALCQLGVDSRLCLYEGENHGLVTRGRPKSKYKRYQELSSWFDKYLKRG